MTMTMQANAAKCLLLAKVLVADGIMTENERAFLDKAMSKMGLSPADRQRVVNLEGWDEAEPLVAKLSLDEKRGVVNMLVDAAGADGRLSPLEAAMVKQIREALGVVD
jgi:tellurite resistance protein